MNGQMNTQYVLEPQQAHMFIKMPVENKCQIRQVMAQELESLKIQGEFPQSRASGFFFKGC